MKRKHHNATVLLLAMGLVVFAPDDILAGGSKVEQRDVLVKSDAKDSDQAYQQYLDFFEDVYDRMDKNYYHPLSRKAYDAFIVKFKNNIYSQLKGEKKSSSYIKWRSAAYLVDDLKDPEDIFSAFFPPKPAKKYEQKVLGKKIDLGIEGKFSENGFVIIRVEPRSNSYKSGLRAKDVIIRIDEKDVLTLSEEEIYSLLTPLAGESTLLSYIDYDDKAERSIEIVSEEYFRQTVFMKKLNVPGVYYLKIEKFNRKTSEDMLNFLTHIRKEHEDPNLILDLRGNPGGPPLAAREISAFFLTPHEDFTYFQKKNKPKSLLDVPLIPERFHFKGNIVILINKESGSASELFSGVMQFRNRAFIMGKNSAGQVFLKSMFNFDDESMLLLVTARGHYPDGSVFSYSGVEPDKHYENLPDDDDTLIKLAAQHLVALREEKK